MKLYRYIAIFIILFFELFAIVPAVKAQQCSPSVFLDEYDCVWKGEWVDNSTLKCYWEPTGNRKEYTCSSNSCMSGSACTSDDGDRPINEVCIGVLSGGPNCIKRSAYSCTPATCYVNTQPSPTPTSYPQGWCGTSCTNASNCNPLLTCSASNNVCWGAPCDSTVPTPTPMLQTCPSDLNVSCANSGPDVTATFTWGEASASIADRYILRVNHQDGENPEWVSTNDHWYYVDDTVGNCNGNDCSVLIDQTTPKKFTEGSYLGWSVQSYKGNANTGVAGCVIEGGPFSCLMPQGNLSAVCTKDQVYNNLSYVFTVDTISNYTGPFNHATFYLNTYDNQAHTTALRAYLGNPNWTAGNWQGYLLGRSTTLSPTKDPSITYTWSTATSPKVGTNQRSVDDISRWMQSNYPDISLNVGANLKYNNIQNDSLNTVNIFVNPTACVEGAGWGVDNVSVCWDANVQGMANQSTEGEKRLFESNQVTLKPIDKDNHMKSFTDSLQKLIYIFL